MTDSFVTPWTIVPLSMGFPSKNTGVGCHALLQGIFPTQGLSPCLVYFLHWQVGFLPLVPSGKPKIALQSWAKRIATFPNGNPMVQCLSVLSLPYIKRRIIKICMVYLFPLCHFQCVCISRYEMNLL